MSEAIDSEAVDRLLSNLCTSLWPIICLVIPGPEIGSLKIFCCSGDGQVCKVNNVSVLDLSDHSKLRRLQDEIRTALLSGSGVVNIVWGVV